MQMLSVTIGESFMSVLTAMSRPRHAVTMEVTDVLTRDRRKKRRIPVLPMYSAVTLRILATRKDPLEGHIRDLSESGISIELDDLIPVGSPVAIEFRLSGLGRLRGEDWPLFAATAEITRHDNLDDFPQGPYRMALRFVKLPTMVQAQIARFVAIRSHTSH